MITIENFLSYRRQEKKKPTLRERLCSLDRNLPVIDPYGSVYKWWRVVMTLVVLYLLFEIPLMLGFTEDFYVSITSSKAYFAIFILMSSLLFLDVIVQLNLGFYANGQFMRERWLLFARYARLDLYIDVYCAVMVPLTYFYYSVPLNILKLLFILKVRRLSQYDEQFLYLLSTFRLGKACYKFFRLVVILLFYSHILACIFFFMDYSFYLNNYNGYRDDGYLWLLSAQCMTNIVEQYGWSGRYLYALYWAIGTVSTVGYGDIFPANPWENLFELIAIINICVLFGYFVNNVFMILTEYHQVQSKLRSLLHDANFYFQQKRVSTVLRYKIRRYLEFTIREQGERDRDEEDEILQKFSEAALKKISYEKYKNFLREIPMYDISESISLNIAAKVRLLTHFEDDIVCEGADCVYYIEKGKVVEYYFCGSERYPMRIFAPASAVKMFEFFTGVHSGRTYKSKRYTELLELNRADCLWEFSDKLKEQFYLLREAILMQDNLAVIQVECSVCKFKHMEGHCPKLHYVSQRSFKWDDGWWQPRAPHERKPTRFSRQLEIGLNRPGCPFEEWVTNFLEYRPQHNLQVLNQVRLRVLETV